MIYVICGQPAGGTSMMMRVMVEGGIPGNYKECRDQATLEILHNPYGCFESQLPLTTENMEGKVTKILGTLPPDINAPVKMVRIIRPFEQVKDSRIRRIRKRNKFKTAKKQLRNMHQTYIDMNKNIDDMIANNKNIDALIIHFDDMFHDTENQCQRIADFVKPHSFDVAKATAAVDKSLYIYHKNDKI